jgi:hypothetical protein
VCALNVVGVIDIIDIIDIIDVADSKSEDPRLVYLNFVEFFISISEIIFEIKQRVSCDAALM